MRHPFVQLSVVVLLGLCAGVALRGEVARGTGAAFVLGAALLAVGSRFASGVAARWVLTRLAVGGVAVGLAIPWAALHRPDPPVVTPAPRHPVLVSGPLSGVARRDGERWIVRSGDVSVRVDRLADPARASQGRHGSANARLRPVRPSGNPGVSEPSDTLLARGIRWTGTAPTLATRGPPPGLIPRARERFRRQLTSGGSKGAAAWGQALVLADRNALPTDLRQSLRDCGLAHLLAVSGLHVGACAMAVAWLAFRLWGLFPALIARFAAPAPASVCAVLAAWGYVAVAGAPVSSVRAAWMITGLAIAPFVGRAPDAASALCLAGWAVFVRDPAALHDVSARLSFTAVGGLLLTLRALDPWLRARSAAVRWVLGPALASAVCTVATLPWIVHHFGVIPRVGLVANVVAIPLATATLVLPGLACLAVSLLGFAPPIGLLEPGQAALGAVARFFAAVPPWDVSGAPVATVIATTAVSVALLALPRVRRGRRRSVAGLGLVVAALGLAWPTPPPPAPVVVTFLDVGQGDAALIRVWTDEGPLVALVDAGGDPSGRWDPGARVIVPALRSLGIRRLDLVVVTHPDADHYAGLLAVARAVPITRVWTGPRETDDPRWAAVRRAVEASGGTWLRATAGRYAFGPASLEVFPPRAHAPSDNDASVVIRLEHGRGSVLLTGDVEQAGEAALVPVLDPVDVLKVAHHGSRTSTSAALLRVAQPRLAVVSARDGGRLGHPHPEVEDRLARVGVATWITGRHGALEVRSWGRGFHPFRP